MQAGSYDYSGDTQRFFFVVKCEQCDLRSFYLAKSELVDATLRLRDLSKIFTEDKRAVYPNPDINEQIIYAYPSARYTIDSRIPAELRELLAEADGCRQMNYLVGASAALRKTIYEILKKEGCDAPDYAERIEQLREKHPHVHSDYFDMLSGLQTTMSDQLHEGSWDGWDRATIDLLQPTLLAVVEELYVVPKERAQRRGAVTKLIEKIQKKRS